MLRLRYSNRIEELAAGLIESFGTRTDPFADREIAVASRVLAARLQFALADQLGVAAGVRLIPVDAALAARAARAGIETASRLDLSRALLAAMGDLELMARSPLRPVAAYLEAGPGDASRRFQLADELAGLFADYDRTRPDIVRAWEGGEPAPGTRSDREPWQRELWRHVVLERGLQPLVRALAHLDDGAVFDPLTIMGVFELPGGILHALGHLAQRAEVEVYALSPTREYWSDVASAAEERADQRRSRPTLRETDAPLALRLWGRPCRDTARALGELAGFDWDDLYAEPSGDTSLVRWQSDILALRARAPDPDPGSADDSIVIHCCPSLERELEVVAEDIWTRMRASPELRLCDIAVHVAGDFELCAAQLASVFHRMGDLPHHVVSLPLGHDSRLVEAFEALVELPLGDFTRSELLRIMIHPAVIAAFPTAAPETWVQLADELGIALGADRGDHQGTYIRGDLYNWDQGARRIALGSVMTPSSRHSAVDVGGFHYRPSQLAQEVGEQAHAFALMSRSLIADARHVKVARWPLHRWSRWFESLIHAYLRPQSTGDERAMARLLAAVAELGRRPDDTLYEYKLSAAIVRRQIAGLSTNRGELAADGVMVAPLEPGHMIPVDTLYVVGLGDSALPDAGRKSPLDVRATTRAGDMEPGERARVAFLEAVLSARSALRLSYVGRDPASGDQRSPSSLIAELCHCVAARTIAHPLRSWDEDDALASVSAPTRLRARIAREREHSGAPMRLRAEPRPGGASATATDEPGGAVELPLSILRGFLESPAQAWARYVLGIADEDESPEIERVDEPLGASALLASSILREVLVAALRSGDDEPALLARLRRRLRAEELGGSFPTGIFAEVLQEEYGELLSGWRQAVTGRPRVVGFGRAREHAEVDQLCEALTLEVAVAGEPRPLRLVGITLPRTETDGALVVAPGKPGPKHRVRGFFDHVVTCAARSCEAAPPGYLLLSRAKPAHHRLPALSPERARGYLAALAAELLGGPHDYALPCELVLSSSKEDLETRGRKLRSRGSTSDSYGPLLRVAELGLPDDAEAVIERRFALLLEGEKRDG